MIITAPTLSRENAWLLISAFCCFDIIVLASISIHWWLPLVILGAIVGIVLALILPEFSIGFLVNGSFLSTVLFSSIIPASAIPMLLRCIVIFALLLYVHRQRTNLAILLNNKALYTVLALGLFLLIGRFYSDAPNYGMQKTINYFINNVFIFIAVIILYEQPRRIQKVLLFSIIFSAVLCVVGGYKIIFTSSIGTYNRLSVFNINPIWVSRAIGLSIITMLFYIPLQPNSIRKTLCILYVLLQFFVMMFTGSRGPVVSLGFVFIFYFFIYVKVDFFKKILSVLTVLLVGGTSLLIIPRQYVARYLILSSDYDVTSFQRLFLLRDALVHTMDNVLFGIGTGGFTKLLFVSRDTRFYPHNIIVEILLEQGLLGIVLLGCFLGMIIYYYKKTFSITTDETLKNTQRILMLILIYGLSNAMFSGDIPVNELIWFAGGAITAIYLFCMNILKQDTV